MGDEGTETGRGRSNAAMRSKRWRHWGQSAEGAESKSKALRGWAMGRGPIRLGGLRSVISSPSGAKK